MVIFPLCLIIQSQQTMKTTYANISCLESRVLECFFLITLNIFWIVCQAQKPTLFLRSFLPDIHGELKGAMFRLRMQAPLIGQEQPCDPRMAKQNLFPGNVKLTKKEPASQSLWVAGTVEGAKRYSCFLPHESCSTKKEKLWGAGGGGGVGTREREKVLTAFQVQIPIHSQVPAYS